jgi:transglutaminase-like putative cysteine protease
MQLTIRHQTQYHYASPASRIALLLRLRPGNFDGQRVHQWQVSVNGEAVDAFSPNSFGDEEGFFQHQSPLDRIDILASGIVETSNRDGLVAGLRRDVPASIFLRSTPLTVPDDAIRALGKAALTDTPLASLHALCRLVRDRVEYWTGATHSGSTASEALQQGRGVCQDHAHIFASAARSVGIPARYVVGYLLTEGGGEALHETHGWAEAYAEGLGWIGFDATNGVCPTDHYVRLCCGLDAHEAAPIRGSVFGAAEIAIDADVLIGEADEAAVQQMQQQQ